MKKSLMMALMAFFAVPLIAYAGKTSSPPPKPTFERCVDVMPEILNIMNSKTVPLRRLSMPLEPYLESIKLGLVVPSPVGPIPGNVLRGKPPYPVASFAISETGQTVAMRILRDGPDSEKKMILHVAKVGAYQLKHAMEIRLPGDGHALRSFFASDDRFLVVEGYENTKSYSTDLYFYDLEGGAPKLLNSMSQKSGRKYKDIKRIDTPDRSIAVFVFEHIAADNEPTFSIAKLDLKTLQIEILAETKWHFGDISSILLLASDDRNRGYAVLSDFGIKFFGDRLAIEVLASGDVRQLPISNTGGRRSFHAAWLISEFNNSTLSVKNEISSELQSYRISGIDFGALAAVSGGFVYQERVDPHYDSVFLPTGGGAAELLMSDQLVFFEAHENFLAGVTSARDGAEPRIEIIPWPKLKQ